MADEFFYLPLSELQRIARFRFGKDIFKIGESLLGGAGGFFHTNDDEIPPGQVECCFLLEDNSGTILRETGNQCLGPEFCFQVPVCLRLEDASGDIREEDNSGCIQTE